MEKHIERQNESNKRKNPTAVAMECVAAFRSTGEETDVQGWYTGIYRDKTSNPFGPYGTKHDQAFLGHDRPVQDADDL